MLISRVKNRMENKNRFRSWYCKSSRYFFYKGIESFIAQRNNAMIINHSSTILRIEVNPFPNNSQTPPKKTLKI